MLFIRDHLLRSGGTSYLLETLAQLKRREIDASLCVLQRPGDNRLDHLRTPVTFVHRDPGDPRRLLDLNRIARDSNPDILHLLGPKSALYGRLVGRWRGIPAIPHFHSLLPEPPHIAFAQRCLAAWTAGALAPSRAARDWAAATYGLDRGQITVVYNGHDLSRYAAATAAEHQAVRREFGISDNTAVIALVGRVQTDQKGQDVMIRLMPRLLQRLPKVVLLIVGEGPDVPLCERLARELDVSGAIRFTGYRDDIPQIMAASDVVVIPSVCEENFPFVALEAAAAGRPTVAFASGGIPEAIPDGLTGTLVPAGDDERLHEALMQLLTDESLYRRLAAAGPVHAAKFTLDKHIDELLQFYDRIREANRP